jgi:hypothetical protein
MSKTTTAAHGGSRPGRGRRRRATRGLVASYIHEVSLRERGRSARPQPVAAWAPAAAIAEARSAA